MGCSLREVRARISSREFSFWQAFDSVDPIGEARADLRTGIVASAIHNAAGKTFKTSAVAADFMPIQKRLRRRPSKKELQQKIMTALLPFKGKANGDNRKHEHQNDRRRIRLYKDGAQSG